MDPHSAEESTPWDPITGKLRAHAGLKLAKGTRDALAKGMEGFGDTRGFSSTSTRCPTTAGGTAANSAFTSAAGSPRRSLADTLDLTQPLQGTMRKSSTSTRVNRSASVPRPPMSETANGSGKRAVRFLNEQREQRSPSRERGSGAMQADPGRYDVSPGLKRRTADASPTRLNSSPSLGRKGSAASLSSTGKLNSTTSSTSDYGNSRNNQGAAMRADAGRYEAAPRGSTGAREYNDASKHTMHMKADPRNDMLNDGSGHNADGDGQTMIGIEIKERFIDMKTAFLKIDTDYDGRITHEDLMEACHDWNIPLSEATRVMNSTDVEQKGFIDFDQFARRFDPYLEVSPDDELMLQLYQQGIMGDEQPISLAGVTHGTSSAEPLVDESKHYRSDNGDLRGRLARSMQCISDLQTDLKASRAKAASLEVSLDRANTLNAELNGQNSELEGRNSVLRRRLEQAEDDKRRMAREIDGFWADQDGERGRMREASEDSRRRTRQVSFEEEEGSANRRRLEELERQLADSDAARRCEAEDDESKTVFIYGLEGCQKTEAVVNALRKAKVPFEMRDYNKDKRYMKAANKSGLSEYVGALFAPVVCLGDKAWWENHEEHDLIPFPQAVAMDLRRELGMNKPTPEKVRDDIEIDTEMAEHFLTMQDAFLKLDDNKDGFITVEELERQCLLWNLPTSEATRVIREADRDGKGFIDFDEFAKRFGGMWNSGCRGPLRSLPRAPNATAVRRPRTSPPVGVDRRAM